MVHLLAQLKIKQWQHQQPHMAVTSAIQNNRLQHQPDGNNITIHHITKQHGNNISQTKTKLQKLMTIWQ